MAAGLGMLKRPVVSASLRIQRTHPYELLAREQNIDNFSCPVHNPQFLNSTIELRKSGGMGLGPLDFFYIIIIWAQAIISWETLRFFKNRSDGEGSIGIFQLMKTRPRVLLKPMICSGT